MTEVIDFLTICWQWAANLIVTVSPFTFSFADIMRTEILVFVAIECIGILYHFGSNYNWRSDGDGGD